MNMLRAELMPYWFPVVGNYLAVSKSAAHEVTNGLGRDAQAMLPFVHLKKNGGLIP